MDSKAKRAPAHKDAFDLSDPNVQFRRCLGTTCGNAMFLSSWAGNRICMRCKKIDWRGDISAVTEYNFGKR